MTKLAARYGISDVGLAKICRRLGVPRPGRGYWEKKRRGRRVTQPPLPKMKDDVETVAEITSWRRAPVAEQNDDAAQKLIAYELEPDNRIQVHDNAGELHPLVATTERSLRAAKANEKGLVAPRARGCLDVAISEGARDRAIRIMDALVKGMESRQWNVAIVDEPSRSMKVTVLGEILEIRLEESVSRKDHVLTPAEQKRKASDNLYFYQRQKYDFSPSGKLSLKIINLHVYGVRLSWSDGSTQRIERRLNSFFVGLINAAVQKRLDREERERQKREWEAEQNRRREMAELIEEEEERLKKLETDAEAWQKSQGIRVYIEAVRRNAIAERREIGEDGELERWLLWASQQADRLDPLVESPPSILDEKKDYRFW
ncbi:MAG: hypothetical protein A3H91_17905 [Gammaproteobacteria bacterium RIFCSPLOWO2_02_FULL_61_13]|nr:MAG: hypothetical protein A3H91_17905 [Gammaproteobacteria bacterium RIFCSPLOWO2_02_FULL_61_13]